MFSFLNKFVSAAFPLSGSITDVSSRIRSRTGGQQYSNTYTIAIPAKKQLME
jgi:hypothetical protein